MSDREGAYEGWFWALDVRVSDRSVGLVGGGLGFEGEDVA